MPDFHDVPLTSHAPEGYVCPFCGLVSGDVADPNNRCEASDVVYQDDDLIVFVAVDGFGPHKGHVMISPAEHYESLYVLPDRVLTRIALMAREVALAMKRAWNPEGISTRQHNEPAGNQHVWHYHLHIFPRYSDDSLYRQLRQPVEVADRQRIAEGLRPHLIASATRLNLACS
ncbi:HIT family protein [Auritidibacter sp. NML130574]|uniref:HIT family protein n=1 Tax=Auritidibacter sp. NML130574 TaxID=2170745 RepID=UPI000D726FE3|nr:HIT family protein [Auritidibacter sp. NML130574]AXR72957.1 HIT family protein [Auritidibacter sp. NML130574]